MATITTAGSGNWDAGATWTGGSVPADGDTASIESGHTCTLTEDEQVGAVVINGGTIAGGGFKITCVKTSGRLFDHSGTITGNLDVELQGTHNTTEDFAGTGNIRNLILNGSGLNVTTGRETSIAGDLTITQGTLTTGSYGFTCSGDVSITGTLNGAGSANHSFGSLTINSGGTYSATSGTTTINGDPGGYPNLGINLDGTFTHNNGTLKYTGGSGGLDLASTGNLYNFEHAPTGTTFITNNTTIENNLTMTGANFQGVNGNENLTVKGNVTINSSGQTMNFNGASEHTFGFLTILDGTYKVQNDTGGFTKVGGIRNVGGTVSNAV